MLRKLAAAVVLAGLCLPYACDSRAITSVWGSVPEAAMFGVPLLAAVAYALLEFLPPAAAGVERRGAVAFATLRAVYVVLAGAYLIGALRQSAAATDRLGAAVALLVTGALVVWQQGKGTKAQRVPLYLLVILGLAVVDLLVWTRLELQIGGWMVTGGWALATIEETRLLRAMPAAVHGR